MIKLLHILIESILDEERRSLAGVRAARDKVIEKDPTSFELQPSKNNRIRNIGDLSSDEIKDRISQTFGISKSDVKDQPPVTDKAPSSLESNYYPSYEFVIPGKDGSPDEKVSLIFTDPKKSQKQSQVQEHNLVSVINSNVSVKKPLTVKGSSDTSIQQVTGAEKVKEKTNAYGKEPYADVSIFTEKGTFKVSAKKEKAPSLGGGGLSGVVALQDEEGAAGLAAFVKSFYDQVLSSAKAGDTRDKFIEIPSNYLATLFRGNEAMGGPVDYYYKGSADVSGTIEGDVLTLNGTFYTPEEYATAAPTYYFKLRKRITKGKFEVTDKVDKKGYPVIYLDSNKRNNSRLVITTEAPSGDDVIVTSTSKDQKDIKEIVTQPSERSRMKNFLYRGTKQQIAQAKESKDEFIMEPYDDEGSTTYSKQKGTIEGKGMIQTDKPYNKRRTVGWEWDELNTLEEIFVSVKTALLGRELQTLESVKKIISRLKERGFSKKEVLVFILNYLEELDEVVGYANITKPSVSGGLTQDTEITG